MANSTTYPPGQVSLLGWNLAKKNIAPYITYVGPNGTKFYLAGPLAPTLGAQNGVGLLGISGLTAPFQHLDNQGARQDGVTWQDALFDAAEIDMQVEVSGLTVADSRAAIRSWIGAWSPKLRGRLHVYTPEMGEWWARVRQFKTPTDPTTVGFDTSAKQRFNWTARNDEAFWMSFDSVDVFKLDSLVSLTDTFDRGPSNNLGSNWIQTYTGTNGFCGTDGNGDATWIVAGTEAREVINRYNGVTNTDYQIISVRFDAPTAFDWFGGVYTDIWGRLDGAGNGIRARIGGNGVFNSVTLSRFVGGTETIMWSQPIFPSPLWNEQWTLICGTSAGLRNFKVQRFDGQTILDYTEVGTNSLAGAAHRGYGFGMAAGAGVNAPPFIVAPQVAPPNIRKFEVGDNVTGTQSGFLNLVNRGDQDGWPRYLCYGPGTFTFSDGPAPSAQTITFGPLLEGQTVLVTTLPRLRGVTDLSDSAPAEQTLTQFQEVVKALVDFATNNNVPPLLQQFESEFGILPPQGNLYSYLKGRFTTPLPPKDEGLPPVPQQIACSITDGNAASKIIAAVTPLRRWPM